nr:hypothetical protein [Tanacetum cinerariifolium]
MTRRSANVIYINRIKIVNWGLWNLSVGEEHKEQAAGALANLAADDKRNIEVANVGGINALVTLARKCKHEGVCNNMLHSRKARSNWCIVELSFNDKNQEGIALAGGVEALVLCFRCFDY